MILDTLNTVMLAAAAPASGSPFGMPPEASTIAPIVDRIYDAITWISIVFFVAIVGFMVYFMWKYRRVSHVADTGGATHHTPLEVTWTVIPLILVIGIFYVGLRGYVWITTPPENCYDIEAVAQQWFWTFNYPNGASESVLYAPANRPVRVRLRSTDMLHAFYVPAFRVKQDVVPGKRTEVWFQATHPGVYPLFCAEYCGTQHSQMVTHVEIYDEDKFETEIEEAARWINNVPDDKLYLAGAWFFNRCANCHTLDGSTLIGPSFTHTFDLFKSGGTRQFADGSSARVDEAYIRHSIEQPQSQIAVDPDTGRAFLGAMTPGMGAQLGPRRTEAMVQFITHLDQATENGKPKLVERDILTGKKKPAEGP